MWFVLPFFFCSFLSEMFQGLKRRVSPTMIIQFGMNTFSMPCSATADLFYIMFIFTFLQCGQDKGSVKIRLYANSQLSGQILLFQKRKGRLKTSLAFSKLLLTAFIKIAQEKGTKARVS